MVEIMKFICLFFGIMFTIVNTGRFYRGLIIPT